MRDSCIGNGIDVDVLLNVLKNGADFSTPGSIESENQSKSILIRSEKS